MDVATLEALGRLSAAALLVAAILALVYRRIYTRGEVLDREAVWRERLTEAREYGAAYKAIAESALAKLDRLTDVVETLSGKKLP